MSPLDLAAGQVLLRCPVCGTTEATDPAVLAGSPRIVCRNCGETWPGAAARAPRLALACGPSLGAGEILDAEPELFAAHPESTARAWAARIEEDARPPPPAARLAYAGAAIGAALFALAFFGGRQAAVAALPDLAGLYAAVGMPVNIAGLAIEEVVAQRAGTPEGERLTVRGAIRNVSARNQPVPDLIAEFPGQPGGRAIAAFEAPVARLAAGGAAPFVLRLEAPPPGAAEVAVRFRRAAEAPPPTSGGLRP